MQHTFISHYSLTSDAFRIPSGVGTKIYEGIEKFLETPEKAMWLLDEGEWPSANEGCNGESILLRSE